MKKKGKLVLLAVSVFIFVVLFYHQSVGLNYGILGLITWGMLHIKTHKRKKNHLYWILSASVLLTSLSQMWYADEATAFTLFFTLLSFGIYAQYRQLAFVFYPIIMMINYVIFLFRFLSFDWLPSPKSDSKIGQKVVAFGIVPLIFVGIFIGIYTTGSDLFIDFFYKFRISLDVLHVLFLSGLGFFFFFNLWMLWLPRQLIDLNKGLSFEYAESKKTSLKSTFKQFDLDLERRSGEITLILLNVLLLVFVITYNYEQFFMEQEVDHLSRLSSDTHTRVGTIIFSIVMAMGVILFYFKSTFNFDPKAKNLKKLAFVWLILNSILILSAFMKNGEYVFYLGLTLKRIGVFIFLILCFVGMYFSYLKINRQKTNYYLITKMAWVFFFTMIFSSTINFSWVVTKYNLTFQEEPDYDYLYSYELDYNYYILKKYAEKHPDIEDLKYHQGNFTYEKNRNTECSVLSKSLYYTWVVK